MPWKFVNIISSRYSRTSRGPTECAAPGRLMFWSLRHSRYRATECAAPGPLMVQSLRYSRCRDKCASS
ncbi:hypothetical protein T265_01700 [Opisthorchis viverrini]|uniref:Uncharacterized protein n=1 Tax=Opisthorchis viverrini TaxID=6198 RepID=A0A075A974_OPIVI|nr:hypothetical protein T265_01700 [Opisthorchis viverrini]KER32275.1 hypothetical protein T265_01700 [Opisthorchis viverrini]